MKKTNTDDGWNRFPETKIRMREDGLKTILDGLSEDGFCSGMAPRFELMDDGVYVEIMLNVGKHGSVVALPLEIFIPAKIPVAKKKKEKKEEVAVPAEQVAAPAEAPPPAEEPVKENAE